MQDDEGQKWFYVFIEQISMDYMNPGKFWYTKLKEQTDTEGKPSGKGNAREYS